MYIRIQESKYINFSSKNDQESTGGDRGYKSSIEIVLPPGNLIHIIIMLVQTHLSFSPLKGYHYFIYEWSGLYGQKYAHF